MPQRASPNRAAFVSTRLSGLLAGMCRARAVPRAEVSHRRLPGHRDDDFPRGAGGGGDDDLAAGVAHEAELRGQGSRRRQQDEKRRSKS